jgi:hypothetical protein
MGWPAGSAIRRPDRRGKCPEARIVRILKVSGFWCLFSVVGLVAVAVGTTALAAFLSDGLVEAFLAVGLAGVLPVSLAVADNVVPRPHREGWPSVSCPHCGTPFRPGPDPKPQPDSWPFL